jgi:hypothetical protein
MNYGLKLLDILDDHYVFGGSSKFPETFLQPDGQWDDFLPTYEPQAENIETCGCTVWGTHNAIEILYKRVFGTEPNYSERFNYNVLHIRCPGADPHKVAESIRQDGLCKHDVLPITNTYEEFVEPDPISGSILARGMNWLVLHDFKHEWVWKTQISNRQPSKPGRTVLRRVATSMQTSSSL